MNELKATPAPWVIYTCLDDGKILIESEDYVVCEIQDVVEQDVINSYFLLASHDLYAALENIVNSTSDLEASDKAQALKALAKARGEQA